MANELEQASKLVETSKYLMKRSRKLLPPPSKTIARREREGAVSAMKAIVKVAADPYGDEGRDARAHVHSDATRGDGTAHAGAAL
jgi:hypothetical protein